MQALRIAALVGFFSIILGAFGAHAPFLKALFNEYGTQPVWQTATLYHLVHAVVLLVLATHFAHAGAKTPLVFWLFFAGIVLFSGSLYLLAVTNVKWLGAITPLGGLSLLAGWLLLAVKGLR